MVLLHGWPFTWMVWRRVLAGLSAAGRSVIAPDLPGTGASDPPRAGYAKVDLARRLLRLLRALGHERTDVVGMDVGAMVAFAWAAAEPESVRRLVLSESLIPGFGLEDMMNPATGGFWHFGFHMQVDVATMLTAGRESEYLAPFWAQMSVGGLSEDDLAAFLRSYSAEGGMRAGFEHYAALLGDGRANQALLEGATLDMPVLVLSGERGVPQNLLLDGVRRAATAVSADVVPAAGHTYAADNPKATVERIVGFLDDATLRP